MPLSLWTSQYLRMALLPIVILKLPDTLHDQIYTSFRLLAPFWTGAARRQAFSEILLSVAHCMSCVQLSYWFSYCNGCGCYCQRKPSMNE
jgi:hypothetical protein